MAEPKQIASESGLLKQLSAGQMAMVAVGGSIGTGLLLGSGAAVQIAGPAVIVTYVVGAFLAWIVTNALGELASAHPAAGSFGIYAELYLNPWAGFVARYGYWFSIAVAVGAEMVAASTYSQYWLPAVPGYAWIAIYSALLLLINARSVGDYGRFEYWFVLVKVMVILAFVLIGGWLLFAGRVPPEYEAHGGFLPNGPVSPLLAVSFALFSFLGIEMVAISSGEARRASDIPKATRIMFVLLAVIYIGASSVLVGVLPWNRAGVSQSPFVTVFDIAGIPAAATLLNFVVLTAALSSANANLYSASRMLFSLAGGGYAPRPLARLSASGSPRMALLVSGFGVLLALVMERWLPQSAFLYLIGASLFGGMLAWCIALAAHISFRRKAAPLQLSSLLMRAPGGAWLSALGLVGIAAAVVSTWWVPQSRITIVSGAPYLGVLTIGYFLARRFIRRQQPRPNAVQSHYD
jgi:AAT family amino acid transporter